MKANSPEKNTESSIGRQVDKVERMMQNQHSLIQSLLKALPQVAPKNELFKRDLSNIAKTYDELNREILSETSKFSAFDISFSQSQERANRVESELKSLKEAFEASHNSEQELLLKDIKTDLNFLKEQIENLSGQSEGRGSSSPSSSKALNMVKTVFLTKVDKMNNHLETYQKNTNKEIKGLRSDVDSLSMHGQEYHQEFTRLNAKIQNFQINLNYLKDQLVTSEDRGFVDSQARQVQSELSEMKDAIEKMNQSVVLREDIEDYENKVNNLKNKVDQIKQIKAAQEKCEKDVEYLLDKIKNGKVSSHKSHSKASSSSEDDDYKETINSMKEEMKKQQQAVKRLESQTADLLRMNNTQIPGEDVVIERDIKIELDSSDSSDSDSDHTIKDNNKSNKNKEKKSGNVDNMKDKFAEIDSILRKMIDSTNNMKQHIVQQANISNRHESKFTNIDEEIERLQNDIETLYSNSGTPAPVTVVKGGDSKFTSTDENVKRELAEHAHKLEDIISQLRALKQRSADNQKPNRHHKKRSSKKQRETQENDQENDENEVQKVKKAKKNDSSSSSSSSDENNHKESGQNSENHEEDFDDELEAQRSNDYEMSLIVTEIKSLRREVNNLKSNKQNDSSDNEEHVERSANVNIDSDGENTNTKIHARVDSLEENLKLLLHRIGQISHEQSHISVQYNLLTPRLRILTEAINSINYRLKKAEVTNSEDLSMEVELLNQKLNDISTYLSQVYKYIDSLKLSKNDANLPQQAMPEVPQGIREEASKSSTEQSLQQPATTVVTVEKVPPALEKKVNIHSKKLKRLTKRMNRLNKKVKGLTPDEENEDKSSSSSSSSENEEEEINESPITERAVTLNDFVSTSDPRIGKLEAEINALRREIEDIRVAPPSQSAPISQDLSDDTPLPQRIMNRIQTIEANLNVMNSRADSLQSSQYTLIFQYNQLVPQLHALKGHIQRLEIHHDQDFNIPPDALVDLTPINKEISSLKGKNEEIALSLENKNKDMKDLERKVKRLSEKVDQLENSEPQTVQTRDIVIQESSSSDSNSDDEKKEEIKETPKEAQEESSDSDSNKEEEKKRKKDKKSKSPKKDKKKKDKKKKDHKKDEQETHDSDSDKDEKKEEDKKKDEKASKKKSRKDRKSKKNHRRSKKDKKGEGDKSSSSEDEKGVTTLSDDDDKNHKESIIASSKNDEELKSLRKRVSKLEEKLENISKQSLPVVERSVMIEKSKSSDSSDSDDDKKKKSKKEPAVTILTKPADNEARLRAVELSVKDLTERSLSISVNQNIIVESFNNLNPQLITMKRIVNHIIAKQEALNSVCQAWTSPEGYFAQRVEQENESLKKVWSEIDSIKNKLSNLSSNTSNSNNNNSNADAGVFFNKVREEVKNLEEEIAQIKSSSADVSGLPAMFATQSSQIKQLQKQIKSLKRRSNHLTYGAAQIKEEDSDSSDNEQNDHQQSPDSGSVSNAGIEQLEEEVKKNKKKLSKLKNSLKHAHESIEDLRNAIASGDHEIITRSVTIQQTSSSTNSSSNEDKDSQNKIIVNNTTSNNRGNSKIAELSHRIDELNEKVASMFGAAAINNNTINENVNRGSDDSDNNGSILEDTGRRFQKLERLYDTFNQREAALSVAQNELVQQFNAIPPHIKRIYHELNVLDARIRKLEKIADDKEIFSDVIERDVKLVESDKSDNSDQSDSTGKRSLSKSNKPPTPQRTQNKVQSLSEPEHEVEQKEEKVKSSSSSSSSDSDNEKITKHKKRKGSKKESKKETEKREQEENPIVDSKSERESEKDTFEQDEISKKLSKIYLELTEIKSKNINWANSINDLKDDIKGIHTELETINKNQTFSGSSSANTSAANSPKRRRRRSEKSKHEEEKKSSSSSSDDEK